MNRYAVGWWLVGVHKAFHKLSHVSLWCQVVAMTYLSKQVPAFAHLSHHISGDAVSGGIRWMQQCHVKCVHFAPTTCRVSCHGFRMWHRS